MNLPIETRQRETDRQLGLHEKRMMDRARFGSPFAAELFDLGASAARDVAVAVAVEQLSDAEATRRRIAAESDELRSEGRVHVNTRPDRSGP